MKATKIASITGARFYLDASSYCVIVRIQNDYNYNSENDVNGFPYGARLEVTFNREGITAVAVIVSEPGAYAKTLKLAATILPAVEGVTLGNFAMNLATLGIPRFVYDRRCEKDVPYADLAAADLAGWTDDNKSYGDGAYDYPIPPQLARSQSEAKGAIAAYMAQRNGRMVERFQAWVLAGCPVVAREASPNESHPSIDEALMNLR